MKALPTKPRITSETSEESRRRIHNFLVHQPIGTLSTVDPDGNPHGAVIYYSIDKDFNVIFTTKRETKKFDNLMHSNHAMLVVYEAMSQTTVQITGTVQEITDQEETDAAFRTMLTISLATSEAGLLPITKLQAGSYVAMRIRPLQIRMAVTTQLIEEIDAQVADAIGRAETNVLSLLMPQVVDAHDAVQIMRMLAEHSDFWLERDEMTNDGQALYLRYPVADTQAWVMAFAPFDFLPNTRRGPFFELAIRVKTKPEWLYHRLNQDRELSHLADVPLVMSAQYWDNRFNSTLSRTRRILGGEPDQVSAAKATLVVPADRLAR